MAAKKKPAKKAPSRGGRPPLPAEQRRSSYLRIRVTQAQKATLQARAERAGLSLTDYILGRALPE